MEVDVDGIPAVGGDKNLDSGGRDREGGSDFSYENSGGRDRDAQSSGGENEEMEVDKDGAPNPTNREGGGSNSQVFGWGVDTNGNDDRLEVFEPEVSKDSNSGVEESEQEVGEDGNGGGDFEQKDVEDGNSGGDFEQRVDEDSNSGGDFEQNVDGDRGAYNTNREGNNDRSRDLARGTDSVSKVSTGEDSANENDDGRGDTHKYKGAPVETGGKRKRCEDDDSQWVSGRLSKAQLTTNRKAALAEKVPPKSAVEKEERRKIKKAKKVELRQCVNMLRVDEHPAGPMSKAVSDGDDVPTQ